MGAAWAVEGDIESYFDTVKHRKLNKFIKRRVADKKVLDLIWRFLKSGVMENKLFKNTDRGVPQGGIISPLLANIYLNELDQFLDERLKLTNPWLRTKLSRSGVALCNYSRYADDFVITVRGTKAEAKSIVAEVQNFLTDKLKLQVSPEKTKITHIKDGYEFLGYRLKKKKRGYERLNTSLYVPDKAVNKLLTRLEEVLSGATHKDGIIHKICAVNRILRGWANYYKYCVGIHHIYGMIDDKTFWLFAHWLARKHRMSIAKIMKSGIYNGKTFAYKGYTLFRIRSIKKKDCLRIKFKGIPNPYIADQSIIREDRFGPFQQYWDGASNRGTSDIRDVVLVNQGNTCNKCGCSIDVESCEIDHIKPVSKFKILENANRLRNLQALCKSCHKQKTYISMVESRVQ